MNRREFVTFTALLPFVPLAVKADLSYTEYPYGSICPDCGKPAFYVNHIPYKGEMPQSKDFLKVNGEHPNPENSVGEELRCGHCGYWYSDWPKVERL